MVTLLVGEDKVPFHVHLDILCRASSVFEAAFMGNYEEASKKSMDLPEDDPEAFESLTQWLYFKKFALDQPGFKDSPAKAQRFYKQLACLYVAADKYNMIELKNETIDRLYGVLDEGGISPNLLLIDYIYENTTRKSQFRRLLVAWYVWVVDLTWFSRECMFELLAERQEFAADVAINMAARANGRVDPFTIGSLGFHENVKEIDRDIGHMSGSNSSSTA